MFTDVIQHLGPSTLLCFFLALCSHLEIGAMTESDIALLVDKCAPATFGRGPEDVLDESYRKALKLDQDAFCWRFNPDSGEFVSRLAQEFCPWDSFESGIRVEPYKLNVYGEVILYEVSSVIDLTSCV
jgi:hypothetical protein